MIPLPLRETGLYTSAMDYLAENAQPCPFCGHGVLYVTLSGESSPTKYYVQCSVCYATGPMGGESVYDRVADAAARHKAVEAWNRRASVGKSLSSPPHTRQHPRKVSPRHPDNR
jgi:Lar family restriction alleviation protein